MHRIAGRHQRAHPQAPVGLDAHHHLLGLGGVLGDERVGRPDTGHPLAEPATGEGTARLVEDLHIVVVLGPVITSEDQLVPPRSCAWLYVREAGERAQPAS